MIDPMPAAALRDEIARLLDELDGERLASYGEGDDGTAAVTDRTIALLVKRLSGLSPGEREQILSGWFEPGQLRALSVFAMRVCAAAAAGRDPDLLRPALVAQVFEGFRSLDDDRVADAVLTTIGETATALGVEPQELAREVLPMANPASAERLRAFYG